MTQEDAMRINFVKLFKKFGESNIPVTEAVFTEYCNKENIVDIVFSQYEDKLLDYREDQVIRESLPHMFRILSENSDLHITDFDLRPRLDEISARIQKVQGEIAHLLKRQDIPYDRHGDIMYRMIRLISAIGEQATETNRKDVEGAIEMMGRKEFGHDITMGDIAEYHQKNR